MVFSTTVGRIIVICIYFVSNVEVKAEDTRPRPNIIIMQPDDFSFFDDWSSPPNNPNRPRKRVNLPINGLPNIEKLRNEGLQMMQAYAASPMCGTSRYTTLTGRYASRASSARAKAKQNNADKAWVVIRTTKLEDINGMNDCSKDNIAATFKSNGYRTSMVGKWHLSDIKSNAYNYESAVETVKSCGFDHVGGLYIENMWYFDNDSYDDDIDGNFSHNMEWITHEAIEFIDSSDDEPFFLYFNPTVPHSSRSVTDALKYFDCRDTANGKLETKIIKGMTEEYDGSCTKYRDSIFERGMSEDDYGAIWLDDSVGALLKALERNKVLDNTIFVFQNDHGMDVKASLFEGGLRIPQFVYYPSEYKRGTKFNGLVSTIDIGATMLDFAGIKPGYEMDGMSWKDAIGNDELEEEWKNRCLFFEHQRDRAVRCGCNKYLHIYSRKKSGTHKNGLINGYSTDFLNLFDMCNGGKDYITEKTSSMEAYGLNHESDQPQRAALISATLECHNIKTNWKHTPNFLPSKISTPKCIDSPLPMSPNKRTCGFFKSNIELCKHDSVAKHCPVTCDAAAVTAGTIVNACKRFACADSTKDFVLKTGDKRKCAGLGNQNGIANMCNLVGVSETCRGTCMYCSTSQCTQ